MERGSYQYLDRPFRFGWYDQAFVYLVSVTVEEFLTMSLVKLMSGRKRESSVWDYFVYDKDRNKSKCIVLKANGDECQLHIAGMSLRTFSQRSA